MIDERCWRRDRQLPPRPERRVLDQAAAANCDRSNQDFNQGERPLKNCLLLYFWQAASSH
jgi:hypothetical protein